MESDESSLGAEGDLTSSQTQLHRSVQTRLHARIMAAAYKYKLMSPMEDSQTGTTACCIQLAFRINNDTFGVWPIDE